MVFDELADFEHGYRLLLDNELVGRLACVDHAVLCILVLGPDNDERRRDVHLQTVFLRYISHLQERHISSRHPNLPRFFNFIRHTFCFKKLVAIFYMN